MGTVGWVRIPDGARVRHRSEAYEGVIDGLTELGSGPGRNPDGKTQYRVKIEDNTRLLASEENLNIVLDRNNLIRLNRESELYRRLMTERLQLAFAEDRFIRTNDKAITSPVE